MTIVTIEGGDGIKRLFIVRSVNITMGTKEPSTSHRDRSLNSIIPNPETLWL